jgi:Bacteriophage lambda head decoration protein D
MTTLTQGKVALQFLLSEADGMFSRDNITILSGEGKLSAGTILGVVKANDGAVTIGAPAFTGTGNGVLTRASPAYGAGVQEGTYTVRLIEAGTDAGSFEVVRPDGSIDGLAVVGTAYDGQVKFTIADGSTDFALAAQFTLAVSIADPTGVGKYRSADPTNTDGSAVGCAVLGYNVDATSADVKTAGFTRDCEVIASELVYDANVDDANKKATKLAELAAVGIIAR